ncbi:MAG: hypothetical protein P8Y58_09980 [Novosphingobium sp.]
MPETVKPMVFSDRAPNSRHDLADLPKGTVDSERQIGLGRDPARCAAAEADAPAGSVHIVNTAPDDSGWSRLQQWRLLVRMPAAHTQRGG